MKLCERKKILLGARAAFGGHVGIAAVPLEGLGPCQIFQRAVVDDVFAEAVGLKIPLQAVDGGVEVAIGAAKLPLKGEVGGVEESLAAAQRVDVSRAAEVDGRYHFVGGRVDDGDVVVQAVGDIEPLAVWREQNAARIVAHRNPGHYIVRGSREIIDERLSSRPHRLQQARDIDHRDALGSGRGQENL